MEIKPFVKAGYFSENVAADSRRGEFDCKNQVLVQHSHEVDFVFIGDSITHMWELNAYFNIPGQLIVNRGIGGDVTSYLLKRFESDVIQLKPKHCVLKIGINDAWDLEGEPLKCIAPTPVQTILDRAVNNISEIVSMCKTNSINLIICSVLPVDMKWTTADETRKKYVVSLNNCLQKICEENELIYVDYFSNMVKADGLTVQDNITIEGLHPNVFGYDIMADVLRQTLNKYDIIL